MFFPRANGTIEVNAPSVRLEKGVMMLWLAQLWVQGPPGWMLLPGTAICPSMFTSLLSVRMGRAMGGPRGRFPKKSGDFVFGADAAFTGAAFIESKATSTHSLKTLGTHLEMSHESPHERLSTRSKKQPQVRNIQCNRVVDVIVELFYAYLKV